MRAQYAARRGTRRRVDPSRQIAIEALEPRTLLSAMPATPLLIELKSASLPDLAVEVASHGAALQPTGLPGVFQATGDGAALGAVARQLAGVAGLGYVEPVHYFHADAISSDPKLVDGTMWGLTGAQGIQAQTAWNVTTGSTKVIVADIDTGI